MTVTLQTKVEETLARKETLALLERRQCHKCHWFEKKTMHTMDYCRQPYVDQTTQRPDGQVINTNITIYEARGKESLCGPAGDLWEEQTYWRRKSDNLGWLLLIGIFGAGVGSVMWAANAMVIAIAIVEAVLGLIALWTWCVDWREG